MSHQIKELIFFANGDPRKAATWSNVPCCLVRELERGGITVHTVDLICHPLEYLYDHFFRRFLRLFLMPFGIYPPYYVRTRLHQWWGERRIRQMVQRYPAADYCLFINYLFYNRYNQIPSLLLSDWPTPFDIRRKGRLPSFLDRRVIRQEKEAISHARHVVSLFKVRAEEMKRTYPDASIQFIGNAFVNNCYGKPICGDEIIRKKKQSKILLFIGKSDRYRQAAQLLIDTLRQLHEEEPQRKLQLHIIGIDRKMLRIPPSVAVICHGYLHKDDPKEREEYYRLLIHARMIINPSPGWAAYSSIVEAMYFYTPVIVSPFDAFVSTFGKEIDFGCYTTPSIEDLTKHIRYLSDTSDYPALCMRAHQRVENDTCQLFVSKMIRLIQS